MRETMRPVSLSRIVETTYFAEKERQFTCQELAKFLNSSDSRGKEIAEELINIGLLCQNGNHYSPTEICSQYLENVRTNNWQGIHELMMGYRYYHHFFIILQSIEPATPEELLAELEKSPIHFNQTSRDVLCDWGERIGSIQRNIFSNQYFAISHTQQKFIPGFLEAYSSLNIKTGQSLKQRYIEIPKIRESICQILRITRDECDDLFIRFYEKNLGKIELAGAPITTHAKKSAKQVKNMNYFELPDKITMKLSSNQFLSGITVGKKAYYYVAYHGGALND